MTETLAYLDRFILTIKQLVNDGYAENEKQIASMIGERNKQGLSDIKRGKKKLKAEHITKLKASVPELNTKYIYDGLGEPILQEIKWEVEILMNQIIKADDPQKRKFLVLEVLDIIQQMREENRDLTDQLKKIKMITGG